MIFFFWVFLQIDICSILIALCNLMTWKWPIKCFCCTHATPCSVLYVYNAIFGCGCQVYLFSSYFESLSMVTPLTRYYTTTKHAVNNCPQFLDPFENMSHQNASNSVSNRYIEAIIFVLKTFQRSLCFLVLLILNPPL